LSIDWPFYERSENKAVKGDKPSSQFNMRSNKTQQITLVVA